MWQGNLEGLNIYVAPLSTPSLFFPLSKIRHNWFYIYVLLQRQRDFRYFLSFKNQSIFAGCSLNRHNPWKNQQIDLVPTWYRPLQPGFSITQQGFFPLGHGSVFTEWWRMNIFCIDHPNSLLRKTNYNRMNYFCWSGNSEFTQGPWRAEDNWTDFFFLILLPFY